MDVPPICPLLFYRDARAALAFMERAFGFETRVVVDDGQGGVIHSETGYEGQVIMVSGRLRRGRSTPRRAIWAASPPARSVSR